MKVVVLEDWNNFFPGNPNLERLRERVGVEVQHDRDVRVGRWNVAPSFMLSGSTMGIVGLGRLGRHLARLGQALNMHVFGGGWLDNRGGRGAIVR
ncbi:MAG: hypothetical protein EPO26_07835 [Chloroflexota bacterium]|nr:MAG: hypothetical protein EPO26_07835 [Chloroflexota bacterium]